MALCTALVTARDAALPDTARCLVILAVVGLVFSAALALLIFPLLPGGPRLDPPTVVLGPVTQSSGTAFFDVTDVSASSPIGLFKVSLAADGSTGSPQSIERAPAYAVVTASGSRYRISWTSPGSSSFLGAGDQFGVTGDGVALPAGTSFAFHPLWRISGGSSSQRPGSLAPAGTSRS